MKPKVLIGFAECIPAPEVAWSLLDAGFDVAAFTRRGTKPLLRRCRDVEIIPVDAPEDDVDAALSDFERAIVESRARVLLPLDDQSLWLSGKIDVRNGVVSAPGRGHVRVALDKRLQIEQARDAGFPVAPTQLGTAAEIRANREVSYPLFLRPANAIEQRGSALKRTGGAVCADDAEFDGVLEEFDDTTLIAQPLLRGTSEGLFGIANGTGVHAWSAHRRIRMVDPQGSGSSACVSTAVPDDLVTPATRFIDRTAWKGMFMFEVLRDDRGVPWFVEFNGRAWGSMALARRMGFEYPAWAARTAIDGASGFDPPAIREGLVCRHLGLEIFHAVAVLRGPRSRALEWPSRRQTLRDLLTVHRDQTWYNLEPGRRMIFVEDTARAVGQVLRRLSRRLR